MTMSSSRHSISQGVPAKSKISWGSDIPEIPLDLGISLEREELGEDSAE
jgi:hypothetical protein